MTLRQTIIINWINKYHSAYSQYGHKDQNIQLKSLSFWSIHLRHLFGFALAERNMSLGHVLVELPPTRSTLYHTACLLSNSLLLWSQLLSSALLDACSKSSTLQLPLREFFLLSLSRFLWLFLSYLRGRGRRLFEIPFTLSLPKSCWVEDFSLGLKDFLTNFFMFFNNLDVKLSTTALRALHQLNFFILGLFIAKSLLHTLLNRLRLVLRILLCHLSFQDSHEILIWLQRSLFCGVYILWFLGWWLLSNTSFLPWDWFGRYWRSLLRYLLIGLWSWFFLFFFISVVLFLFSHSFFWVIDLLLPFFNRPSLIFISTHSVSTHLLLQEL